MEFVLLIISIFFIVLAFVLTENNAKYLLAGYNTMSPEDRKKVDVKGLIAYFKRFFIFLGVSLMIVGLVTAYYLSEKNTTLIISFYIVIACFIWLSVVKNFIKNDNYSNSKLILINI